MYESYNSPSFIPLDLNQSCHPFADIDTVSAGTVTPLIVKLPVSVFTIELRSE